MDGSGRGDETRKVFSDLGQDSGAMATFSFQFFKAGRPRLVRLLVWAE